MQGIDFAAWEQNATGGPTVDAVPLTRYWLIPSARRPKVYSPHPLMSPDDIRHRTQAVWDRFYGLAAIWHRSTCVRSMPEPQEPALMRQPIPIRMTS
jgi:hypothetical protein